MLSQSIYKQKYDTSNTVIELKHEESLFSTGFVPLLLKVEDAKIWKGENPSSCHFCRPLHLQYKKESSMLEEETSKKSNIYVRDILQSYEYCRKNGDLYN